MGSFGRHPEVALMGDMEQYRPQVSPELPKGPSPFQLLARFNPPENAEGQALAAAAGSLAGQITEMVAKAQAADQTQEIARARAQYFSSMTDWTRGLSQSDVDPKEYGNEFSRKSSEVAGEISKGFRYAESLDQFSTWKLEQDVPLLGDTLKQQLTAMNDRFGATLQKDLQQLRDNPGYLATVLANITTAESSGAIDHTPAEQLRQNAMNLAEVGSATQEALKLGSAKAVEMFADSKKYPGIDQKGREEIVRQVAFQEQVKQSALNAEDDQLAAHYADLHLKARTPADVYAALDELKSKQFHNGNLTYEWQQRFRALLAKPDPDWTKKPPDQLTMVAWSDIRDAMDGQYALRDDKAMYGSLAGKVPSQPRNSVWLSENIEGMGNQYDNARDWNRNFKSGPATFGHTMIDRLMTKEGAQAGELKAPITWDQAAQLHGQLDSFVRETNPKRDQIEEWIVGRIFAFSAPRITSDQGEKPTADFVANLWNGGYSDAAAKGDPWYKNQAAQHQTQATLDISKYFGKKPDETKVINGIPQFRYGGKVYAYVPEKFDAQSRKYSGNPVLKVYQGGQWKVPPAPEVKAGAGYSTVKAAEVGKLDVAGLTIKIAELKAERQSRQAKMQELTALQNNPNSGMSPMAIADQMTALQKILQGIDTDIANLEAAREKRTKQ
jgi:hypothetical protein